MVPVDRLPIRPPPDGVYASEKFICIILVSPAAEFRKPIPVKMPNTFQAQPGDRIDLWYYDESPTPDPNSNQWKPFGMGTVSDDGRNIIPDPGVSIPKFCCGASIPQPEKPQDSPQGSQPSAGKEGMPHVRKHLVTLIMECSVTFGETDIGYPISVPD